MIARIFNMLPVPVKMLDDKKQIICKIREIVYKNQFYDTNEFFTCKLDYVKCNNMTYFKSCQRVDDLSK
jgi:hypothetical protein